METKNRILYILLIFLTIIISLSCEPPVKPNDQKDKANLTLTLEDVSCTEAWLKLTTTNLQLPATISLYRIENTITRRTDFSLSTKDTLIYIDSLLPKQSYKFKAVALITTNNKTPTSNELSVLTMEPTSHNFTWQTFTFGEHSNSILRDVAIIDENNIWVVGEIYMKDSIGKNDPNAYNAVHWNGSEWKLKRIMFYSFCPQGTGSGSYPAKSIFAFGPTDIWIGSDASQVVRWNGNSQSLPVCTPVSINKLWGSSSNDLYAVGNNGNIAHWDGRKWTKIESGTDVRLSDIDGKINGNNIFVSGYNTFGSHKSCLIKISNRVANIIWMSENTVEVPPYGFEIHSICLLNNDLFISSSRGVFSKNVLLNTPAKELFHTGWIDGKISGTAKNDVYTFGPWSNIYHYNGLNARLVYHDFSVFNRLVSGKAKDKIIVGVGTKYVNPVFYKAIIVIGKRK